MDGITFQMQTNDVERLRAQNQAFNQVLTNKTSSSTELGKDDFLKILMTQLTNQDPTEPMQDKEFIAQMAQFSTLEQMTNLSQDFGKLGNLLQSGQAVSLLGKYVDINLAGATISGRVQEVTGGDYPQVLVNGAYYDYSNVNRVRMSQGATE